MNVTRPKGKWIKVYQYLISTYGWDDVVRKGDYKEDSVSIYRPSHDIY